MKIPITVTQITRLSLLRVLRCFLLAAALASVFILTPKSHAESFDVTAKVDSPVPTSPAVISSPVDQQHFNTSPITLTGTCGDGTYVALFRNGAFAGTAACTGGFFTIQVALTPGSNVLQAKNYNNTDNEGPESSPITVFYDIPSSNPALPPKSGTPLNLEVTSIDGIPFSPGRTYPTSPRPIIQGTALPYSIIVISFGPDGPFCRVTADVQGDWTCQLSEELGDGPHQITVSSTSPQGVVTKLALITIISSHANQSPTGASGGLIVLYFPYNYRTYKVNELWKGDVSILGGMPPYTTSVDWNDSSIFQYKNSDSQVFTISHTFAKPGNYQPIINVTDQHGDKASLQLLIAVVGEEPRSNPVNENIMAIIGGIGVLAVASIVTELGIVASSFFSKKPPAPKK